MANEIKIFGFEGIEVRIEDRVGEPWFVAADVCRILEIKNPRDAVASLDDDEKGVAITDTLGGPQELLVISEPGLYRLVGRSRKQAARRFDRWVRHEVLPSIRKTGKYEGKQDSSTRNLTLAALKAIVQEFEVQSEKISNLEVWRDIQRDQILETEERLKDVESHLPPKGYMTLVQYASLHGAKDLSKEILGVCGKRFVKYCKAHDEIVIPVSHPHYAKVNSYPIGVLDFKFREFYPWNLAK